MTKATRDRQIIALNSVGGCISYEDLVQVRTCHGWLYPARDSDILI